jgi:hypothetical protein
MAWEDETRWARYDHMSEPYQSVTQDQWAAWLATDDRRARRISFARFLATRRNFSAIWARAAQNPDGTVVGVVTVNVESQVVDGYHRLEVAGTEELLYQQAAMAGRLIARN